MSDPEDVEVLPGDRAKSIQAIEVFLRMIGYAVENFPGDDCETILVFLTAAAASASANLRNASILAAMNNEPIPEVHLRPISGRAIAASCGLPRETVRRRLESLVDQGRLERTRGGYTLAYSSLSRDRNRAFTKGLIRTLETAPNKLAQFDAG